MTWGKFFLTTTIASIILWVLFFLVYGNFFLYNSIVPCTGVDIDKWVSSYYLCGVYSVIAGFICSICWYAVGDSYDGRSSVTVVYWLFMALSFVAGILVYFLLLLDSLDGSGASAFFVVITAPLVYFLSSSFASPDMVKFVPPVHF